MRRPAPRWFAPLLAAPLMLAGCGTEKSEKSEKTGPNEQVAEQPRATVVDTSEPLPALRTGSLAPVEHAELKGAIAAWRVEGEAEYVEVKLPITGDDLSLDWDRLHVELEGGGPGHVGVLANGTGASEAQVLVRRPKSAAAPEALRGALFARRWQNGRNEWVRVPFGGVGGGKPADDAQLVARWADALAHVLGDAWTEPHPWKQFAAGRIATWLKKQPVAKSIAGSDLLRARPARTDLSQLMDTTTGVLSMQEALQHDRGLRLSREEGPRTVALASLKPPPLAAHPFAAMQAALPDANAGTPEPLAAATPAEFWYARVDDVRLLLRLLDEADTWITPVVQILQQNPEDRGLTARYQRQLGLRRSDLAKLFGHTVVGEVAIVGSDPYLREGTDVTLIFALKQPEVFEAELARQLDGYRGEIAGIEASTVKLAGVEVQRAADPAGQVRQHRARVGDLAFVSNSPGALARVLAAAQGQAPRLADEPDLKYMLARDPGVHQALAFLSDKFIAAVIGPQQKILAARRQEALAELLVPGYAALLHGWLFGHAPKDTQELIAANLLAADELKHAGGEAIAFAPGQAARSLWGSPDALTPLVDLPAIEKVSAAEQTAYDNFALGYQNYWQQFIDPVAIRLDVRGAVADVDVRVLPLISATDYSEIEGVVGKSRVAVTASERGVSAVWAVGQDSGLRRDMDQLMRTLTGKGDVGLGWLGDWVMLGLDDRAGLVGMLSQWDDAAQLPPKRERSPLEDQELWRQVGKFPIYAAAEVKNPTMLVATLAALKATLESVAPGMVQWGEVARHRELPIVRIGISPSAPLLPDKSIADAAGIYYVQTGAAIVVGLDRPTVTRVIDDLLDGRLPKAGAATDPQFVMQSRSTAGAPLWTALLWTLQGQANTASKSALRSAEILLRGDPQATQSAEGLARLGLQYFGFAPLNAHGTPEFTLRPEGAADPLQGSAIAPSFPPLPIPGSPIERLMQRLTAVRGEVSFDKEPEAAGPDARSLRTKFSINLGAAAP
ncbi:hypothetical protein [Nannocystis punicea]|uniref:Lipoprotein n=1 Tax=Nannocystis punicea TaxID=2995304 RepID=A0ABY7H5T1_9BACT|nr:hypothetical protein [Nannocystis poenicansa]WAS94643.1 hypothetical protein O0S08_00650 [Nannocystis poenicansa]